VEEEFNEVDNERSSLAKYADMEPKGDNDDHYNRVDTPTGEA